MSEWDDEGGGRQLVFGYDGSDEQKVAVDADGNLQIDILAYDAAIRTNDDMHTIELVLDAGNAYADGDVLSDRQEIANAVRSDGVAVWQSLQVVDADGEEAEMDIWILASDTTIGDANDAENLSDEDVLVASVGVYESDYETYNNFSVATIPASRLGQVLKPDSGTSLWVAAVSRGTPTYTAADDVSVKIGLLGS